MVRPSSSSPLSPAGCTRSASTSPSPATPCGETAVTGALPSQTTLATASMPSWFPSATPSRGRRSSSTPLSPQICWISCDGCPANSSPPCSARCPLCRRRKVSQKAKRPLSSHASSGPTSLPHFSQHGQNGAVPRKPTKLPLPPILASPVGREISIAFDKRSQFKQRAAFSLILLHFF